MSSNLSVLRVRESLSLGIDLLLFHAFDPFKGFGHLIESLKNIWIELGESTYLMIVLRILLI